MKGQLTQQVLWTILKWMIVVMVIQFGFLVVQARVIHNFRKEVARLESNQDIFLSSMSDTFRMKDSCLVVLSRQLELTMGELRQFKDSMALQLMADRRELGIRERNLQSMHMATTRQANRDTLRLPVVIHDTIHRIQYSGTWQSLQGTFQGDTLVIPPGGMAARQSYREFISRQPRGWKFWQKDFWQGQPYVVHRVYGDPQTEIEGTIDIRKEP